MIKPFINIHTHHFLYDANIQIVNANLSDKQNNKLFSIGIYPLDVMDIDIAKTEKEILNKVISSNCLAIGEVGIDRRGKDYLEKQKEVFIKMQTIANNFNKPLIIHCVRAWADLLQIRKSLNANNIWIFHGFNGNLIVAKQLIEKGCYLSFGKTILYNKTIQDVFQNISLSNVFFETDDDRDILIEDIYIKASELKKIDLENLKNIVYSNFIKIFEMQWKKIG